MFDLQATVYGKSNAVGFSGGLPSRSAPVDG